jgi:hypothetical protein
MMYKYLRKMNLTFFTKLTLLFFLAAPSFVQAQQQQAGPVKFSCAIWKNLSLSEVFYRQGKEFIPLKLSAGNRSELYSLKGAAALELYTLIAAEQSETGKAEYRLVGQSTLPVGVKRILYFITEIDNPEGLPFRLSGVDDSLLSFPRGAFRFVNLTNVPLKVYFGEEVNEVAPKKMTLVKSKVSREGGLLPFIVQGPNGRNVYENRFFAQETGRDMVFILPPSNPGGRVNVRLLPQLIAYPRQSSASP